MSLMLPLPRGAGGKTQFIPVNSAVAALCVSPDVIGGIGLQTGQVTGVFPCSYRLRFCYRPCGVAVAVPANTPQ